jgi:hypothetical protein
MLVACRIGSATSTKRIRAAMRHNQWKALLDEGSGLPWPFLWRSVSDEKPGGPGAEGR